MSSSRVSRSGDGKNDEGAKMSVRFSSRTNSTLFTECCGTAICDDQWKCPGCGKEISESPRQRNEIAMVKLYGREQLAQMRASYDEK